SLSKGIAALEHVTENIAAQLPSRHPMKDLEEFDETLDPMEEALHPLRDQQQRVNADRRDFEPAMAKAQSAIDTADSYIRRRRGAVRHDARTKLSAAQTHFDSARKLGDRKSTRLNSSHVSISYAVFCLKQKKDKMID